MQITTDTLQAAPAVKGVPAATGILRAELRQAIAVCEAVRARHRTAKDHADKAEALLCVAGERAERMKSDLREPQYNGTPCGPGSLGMMTIVVTNLGTDISNPGSVIGLLQSNAGIPLPFARYTVDYGALKVAAAAGNKLVCNTF